MSEQPYPFYLREWREHRGLTQQALADAVGISKPHVSELERGIKQYTRDMLFKLAEALDIQPVDLLARDPSQAKPIWQTWDDIPKGRRDLAARTLEAFVDPTKKAGS